MSIVHFSKIARNVNVRVKKSRPKCLQFVMRAALHIAIEIGTSRYFQEKKYISRSTRLSVERKGKENP